jgi:hypothetical protein
MNVYSLTPLLRSANQQRRVVIQGFDLPVRGLTIAGLALAPSLVIAAILWPFFNQYALVAIPIIELFAFWVIESRTRSGLQLRQYQRFVDKRRSASGTFLVCNRPITPLSHIFGHVLASSVPGLATPQPSFVLTPDSRRKNVRRAA